MIIAGGAITRRPFFHEIEGAMTKTLVATKTMLYATRQLRPGDEFTASPRDARVLIAVGKAREAGPEPASPPAAKAPDEITTLRAEYEAVVGRRAYHGWDADQLREKIAAFRQAYLTRDMGAAS